MAGIETIDVSKSFGAVKVLKNVSVSIADGEFLVLVGPSGCGKSTLLRIISGLEQLSSGEILIDGKDVTDLPAKQRDIAMVFQSYALYPHMTVSENMGFSLKLRGESRDIIKLRVGQAAETLGLTEYLHRKPAALSGGQRQRVAMGRAIIRDPKVFLFDEPLSNLDAKLRVAMRAEIKSLHQRLKTTIVYVTHDQVEALTLADRIVVLRDGEIEQVGTPLELFDFPVNTFVAQFIGSPSMNLLPGQIESTSMGLEARLDIGGSVVLTGALSGHAGRRVSVGIRPEHFKMANEPGSILGKVETVEPLGSQMQLGFTAGLEKFVVIFNERIAAAPGDTLHLSPQREAVHIFDAETGQRLAAVN